MKRQLFSLSYCNAGAEVVKLTYGLGKRQRKQVQSLCEHVAVRGKSAAAEISRNYLRKVIGSALGAEKASSGRIIPEPEDFPISAQKRQREPAESRGPYRKT